MHHICQVGCKDVIQAAVFNLPMIKRCYQCNIAQINKIETNPAALEMLKNSVGNSAVEVMKNLQKSMVQC